MNITDRNIDKGRAFDWGRTSSDYAKYRDIYPEEFYRRITERGLCTQGQKVLDLGTGTGVLPRNMYRFGAKWTATDISENQIEQAKLMSQGMDIKYHAMSAEEINFPDASFDVITACQCFFYFKHEQIMPTLRRILKPDGRILVLYMAWLPHEDKIASESEKLVLRYNPSWSGHGETMRPIFIPDCYNDSFELIHSEEYRLNVRFTRESWHGRIKACRGVGASLAPDEIAEWEKEHKALLCSIAPEEFDIVHYAAMAELKRK
ncbi:MAG: methyltransferase domain-containing protein [Oscillospiraceae bacterium]|nr:methyltransferase domain-containing protein [Oscillospiraceae bacterium]